MGAASGERVPDRLGLLSQAEQGTCGTSVCQRENRGSEPRDSSLTGQRGHRESRKRAGSGLGICLPTTKKRRVNETYLQPEATEPVHPLRAFQDGGGAHGYRHDSSQQLVHKVGLKGRLHVSSDGQGGEKVPKVSMGGPAPPISYLPIRVGVCTENVHKNSQARVCSFTSARGADGHLSGRYGAGQQRPQSTGLSDKFNRLAPAEIGLCSELGEISTRADPSNRLLGFQTRFTETTNIATCRESARHSAQLQGFDTKEACHGQRSGSSTGEISGSSEGNSAGATALPKIANVPGTDFAPGQSELRDEADLDTRLCRGAELVDRPNRDLEWEVNNSSMPRLGCHDGCVEERLGGGVLGDDYSGALVTKRVERTHQCVGTEGSLVCGERVCEKQKPHPCSRSGGQHSGSGQHKQDGGNEIKSPVGSDQTTVVVLSSAPDHSYSRAPAGSEKHNGRLSIPGVPGLQQLEVEQQGFPANKPCLGSDAQGSVCRPFKHTTSNLCQLETRSRSGGNECSGHLMGGEQNTVCFSPILLDHEMSGKDSVGSSRTGFDCPDMADTSLVRNAVADGSRLPESTTPHGEPIGGPEGGAPSTAGGRNHAVSSMENLRESWKSSGFSDTACKLLGQSIRPGTQSVYGGAWAKWDSWCKGKDLDPFQAPVVEVINFLSESFSKGLEYSTLNGYRSAISAFHREIDGVKVGQHAMVKQFMAGVFNERPPHPRYTHTWDVDIVLAYMEQINDNDTLSDKELTYKLTTLLALTTAARAHEIRAMDPTLIEDYGDRIIIHIKGLTKTKRQSKQKLSFTVHCFENDKLDVIRCLKNYLERTQSWRKDKTRERQLLLGLVGSHKPVSACTVSRWMKEFLMLAGIDTEMFKAHSVRGAATSKAAKMGLTLETIIQKANWSNVKTFQRFYHKEVQESDSFENVVLRK